MIRAVLFDLDDTLFDHAACARAALEHVHGTHESFSGLPLDALERAHAETLEELHLEVLTGRLGLDDARVERFRRLFVTAGTEADHALASAAAAAYRQRYLDARKEVEGAGALLAAVHERAQIAIVSNNLLEEQQDKLRCCGLDRYVDALVVSEVVGVSKPDRRMFETALAELSASAGDAVMVGDSWSADIVGAQHAGIRAVWFNPRGAPVPEPLPGVREIRSLHPTAETLAVIFDSRQGPASAGPPTTESATTRRR